MKPETKPTHTPCEHPTFKAIMERIAFHAQTHDDINLLKTRYELHEELVHSLKEVLMELEELGITHQTKWTVIGKALLQNAHQIIAKAEGKE